MTRVPPILLTSCLALAACAGDKGDTATTASGTAVSGATLQVEVYALEPKPGAEVCLVEGASEACVTTGDDGLAVFQGLPEDSEIAYTVTATDFMGILVPTNTGAEGSTTRARSNLPVQMLYENNFRDNFASAYGFTWDETQGHMVISTRASLDQDGTDDLAGVSGSLDPDSGEGPAYGVLGEFDSADTETSDLGEILWANLPDGTYEVSTTHPSRTCAPLNGWAASAGGTIRVPVRGGWSTQASVYCPE